MNTKSITHALYVAENITQNNQTSKTKHAQEIAVCEQNYLEKMYSGTSQFKINWKIMKHWNIESCSTIFGTMSCY